MEICFGCTKDFAERFKEHASKETEALKHWNFDQDQIAEGLVQKDLTQEEASQLAHALERAE